MFHLGGLGSRPLGTPFGARVVKDNWLRAAVSLSEWGLVRPLLVEKQTPFWVRSVISGSS